MAKKNYCTNHPEVRATHSSGITGDADHYYCCFCWVLVLRLAPADWHSQCMFVSSLLDLQQRVEAEAAVEKAVEKKVKKQHGGQE